jgi:hypothetical protein
MKMRRMRVSTRRKMATINRRGRQKKRKTKRRVKMKKKMWMKLRTLLLTESEQLSGLLLELAEKCPIVSQLTWMTSPRKKAKE